jgi:hypothetical protein
VGTPESLSGKKDLAVGELPTHCKEGPVTGWREVLSGRCTSAKTVTDWPLAPRSVVGKSVVAAEPLSPQSQFTARALTKGPVVLAIHSRALTSTQRDSLVGRIRRRRAHPLSCHFSRT